jgi:hypothetical protein
MNSSAAKPPPPLVLDTNPDNAAIDISDVVAPTTTRCAGVMECSDDDNNEPNKATHVITPGAPPLTTVPLSKVYPSVAPSSEIQGGYLICFEDTHLVITKMSQLLWKPQYSALKPRLNLWQSQSSGSVVSKLRNNGFWMFNLFSVLVLRKTRESNLLPSYTEKHLKMVVLELPKVAAIDVNGTPVFSSLSLEILYWILAK